jgi:uncharacterized protein YndB with AHSA1/START domain
MNDLGEVTAPGEVRLERRLPGPIERVWAYLTDPEKRGLWLAPGPLEPRLGGTLELDFRHADLSPRQAPTPERYRSMDETHRVVCRVTRWEPPRLLSYSWGEEAQPSEVTFELTPVGDEVHLILTHRRLKDRPEMISVASGWHTHVAILIDRLSGQEPENFWLTHAAVEAQYEARFAQV